MKILANLILAAIGCLLLATATIADAAAKSVMHEIYAALLGLGALACLIGIFLVSLIPENKPSTAAKLAELAKQERFEKQILELRASINDANKWAERADELLQAIEKNTRK